MKIAAALPLSARKLSRLTSSVAIAVVTIFMAAENTQTAVANGDTRTLSFYHTHSKERITVTFKKNGRYDADGLKKLNYFLRDWRNQKQTNMEPRLFDVVWEVYQEAGTREPIQIISAYRSPETNETLRSRSSGVAKFSQHTLGRAMDIHIPGINMSKVREAGLRLQRGGVGFYPTSGLPFVHLDVGNVRMWPRMTRDQLARVFPDGRTVYIPSDGKPLKNYALALADVKKQNSTVGKAFDFKGQRAATMVAENTPTAPKGKGGGNFLTKMLGGGDDEEDTTPASAPEPIPASAPQAPVAAAVAIAQVVPVPVPVARPTSMAYAAEPELPMGPEMAWMRGAEPVSGRAAASVELASLPSESETTPSYPMPMPRPFATTTTPEAAITAYASPEVPMPVVRPSAEAPIMASAGLSAPAAEAARLLASTVRDAVRGRNRPVPTTTASIAPAAYVAPSSAPSAMSPDRSVRDRSIALEHPDFASAGGLFVPPSAIVPVSFGGNPTAGLRSDAFAGPSVALLRTQTFGASARGASLIKDVRPRG